MKNQRIKAVLPYLIWGLVGVVVLLLAIFAWSFMSDESEDFSGCNVLGLNVHGCIVTYAPAANEGESPVPEECDAITVSEDIMDVLERASKDNNIKAVLLDIDSGGGQPQAAVEIEAALKASGLPSVAWIRAYGDSAAYWIASAADIIIASKESDVGSIGVSASYTDNAKQNAEEGLTYNVISTGKYKDIGSPDKSLTADERALIEKSNRISLENFIETVVTNRGLSTEKVRTLADGSSWLGEEALSLGLIDTLGTYPEVLSELRNKLEEEPVICWQ